MKQRQCNTKNILFDADTIEGIIGTTETITAKEKSTKRRVRGGHGGSAVLTRPTSAASSSILISPGLPSQRSVDPEVWPKTDDEY